MQGLRQEVLLCRRFCVGTAENIKDESATEVLYNHRLENTSIYCDVPQHDIVKRLLG